VGKPFQLVSVSSDDDEDVWKTFIKAEHMDWPEYIDLSGDVLHAFKVESFPTFVVLDKDGVIRFRQSGEGPSTEGELEDAINKYLKRESDPKLAAAAAAEAPSPPLPLYRTPLALLPEIPLRQLPRGPQPLHPRAGKKHRRMRIPPRRGALRGESSPEIFTKMPLFD
jgi:hypothetical protein